MTQQHNYPHHHRGHSASSPDPFSRRSTDKPSLTGATTTFLPSTTQETRHVGERTTSPSRLPHDEDEHDFDRGKKRPRPSSFTTLPRKTTTNTSTSGSGSGSGGGSGHKKRLSGTINHRGRHANDWLFGGFSLRDQVVRLWRGDEPEHHQHQHQQQQQQPEHRASEDEYGDDDDERRGRR